MTSSGVDLHAAPAAGFDVPLAMVEACHERIERTLRLLERLAAHLRTHGVDAAARDAARDVLRYFDIAAPLHHEDEERHLLPALRARGEGALAQRVLDEHRQLGAAWARLRPDLQALEHLDDAACVDFVVRYRAHLALEDSRLLPGAATWFDAEAQRAIGEEMAVRRGVPLRPRARAPTASR